MDVPQPDTGKIVDSARAKANEAIGRADGKRKFGHAVAVSTVALLELGSLTVCLLLDALARVLLLMAPEKEGKSSAFRRALLWVLCVVEYCPFEVFEAWRALFSKSSDGRTAVEAKDRASFEAHCDFDEAKAVADHIDSLRGRMAAKEKTGTFTAKGGEQIDENTVPPIIVEFCSGSGSNIYVSVAIGGGDPTQDLGGGIPPYFKRAQTLVDEVVKLNQSKGMTVTVIGEGRGGMVAQAYASKNDMRCITFHAKGPTAQLLSDYAPKTAPQKAAGAKAQIVNIVGRQMNLCDRGNLPLGVSVVVPQGAKAVLSGNCVDILKKLES
jgi:hypothetical protein